MKAKRLLAVFAAFMMSAAVFAVGCGGDAGSGGEGPEGPGGEQTQQYTVTFNLNGAPGTAPSSAKVDEGGKVSPPDEPSWQGYNFNGWYTQATGGEKWDFDSEVTQDITLYAQWTANGGTGEDTSTKLTGKIYLVGDSTVCDYEKTSKLDYAFLPRYGYGTQLYNYINCEQSQIDNLALSGRSSLSYLGENYYKNLKDSISSGDYLIIGFGHNDEKTEAERFTDPSANHTTAATSKGPSFQYTLYENYVKMAKDAGATPILCTPIVRYDPSGAYTGNSVHVTADGDYAQAIRDLGTATDTVVIDLTKITEKLYKSNNDEVRNYHYISKYVMNGTEKEPNFDTLDKTHLNKYGAKVVAYELAQALLKSDCDIKNNIITNAVAPTYEADFKDAQNNEYVNTQATTFDPANTQLQKLTTTTGETTADWYATAFGVLGGNKAGNFETTYENGKFTIRDKMVADKVTGKFANTDGDGFAAAFTAIPVNKNFTASVKAKVISQTGASSQSGFGMMIRDDIFENKEEIGLKSNFIAGGGLWTKCTIFDRIEQELKYKNSTAPAENTEYTITITRQGQSITVTVENGASKTEQDYQDVKMNSSDGGCMYLCLFANRGLTVEYTDLQFTITGEFNGE